MLFNSFIYISVFIGLIILAGIILSRFRKKKGDLISIDEISVLIPFRNEEKAIVKLLESIEKLTIKPKEWIFINDHSNDSTVKILHESLPDISILELDDLQFGKKSALKLGVNKASHSYILTLDADTEVPRNYFEKLAQEREADMIILPVKMKGTQIWSCFANFDYYFLNAISYALSGFNRSIVASGANLLFRKDFYLNYNETKSHLKYSSGDDIFLLKAFKDNGASIVCLLDSNLAVKTNSPRNFKAFLNQRLRWIGKTKRVKDNFANFIGIVGLFQILLFAILLFYPSKFFVVFAIKLTVDLLICSHYLIRINEAKLLIFTPFFTLIYPFYVLILFFLNLLIVPTWKGRKVKQ